MKFTICLATLLLISCKEVVKERYVIEDIGKDSSGCYFVEKGKKFYNTDIEAFNADQSLPDFCIFQKSDIGRSIVIK
jgi:hypothetical protein